MDIGVSTGSSYCVGSQAPRAGRLAYGYAQRPARPLRPGHGTLTTRGPPGRDRLASQNPGLSCPENKAANPPAASLGVSPGGQCPAQLCQRGTSPAGGSKPASSGPCGGGARGCGTKDSSCRVHRLPRDRVPARRAERPVAGGRPASRRARRVSDHGACARHTGREVTSEGRWASGTPALPGLGAVPRAEVASAPRHRPGSPGGAGSGPVRRAGPLPLHIRPQGLLVRACCGARWQPPASSALGCGPRQNKARASCSGGAQAERTRPAT